MDLKKFSQNGRSNLSSCFCIRYCHLPWLAKSSVSVIVLTVIRQCLLKFTHRAPGQITGHGHYYWYVVIFRNKKIRQIFPAKLNLQSYKKTNNLKLGHHKVQDIFQRHYVRRETSYCKCCSSRTRRRIQLFLGALCFIISYALIVISSTLLKAVGLYM